MSKPPYAPMSPSEAENERHRITEDVLTFIEAGVDAEVPDFNDLQDEYGPQGFVMVAVAVDNPDAVKDFAIEHNVNYQILVNDGKVSSLYGPIRSLPTTFVIDKEMKVARMYIGFRPKEVFEKDIRELLGVEDESYALPSVE